jgi:hypothetical protein
MKTTNQIDREANERKAREIANDNCTHICLADCSAESYFSSENDCYKAAMQAMKWKDKERKYLWRITRNHYQEWAEEQIAQEKQKLIDKACEWWKNEFKTHEMNYKDSKDWYNSKVERFKQAMKGE